MTKRCRLLNPAGGRATATNSCRLTSSSISAWLNGDPGNGQIIGDPETIIEWTGAMDQSRSMH